MKWEPVVRIKGVKNSHMATITKRKDNYRIRVSCGYTADGKQVIRSMTWKPSEGMTPRQIEKEKYRQAVLFEEKCHGGAANCNMKFRPFAEMWFKNYAEKELRPRTLAMMHGLEPRTYTAIGHLRIDKITALQIQEFIENLSEKGINQKTGGGLSPKTQSHYLSFISDVLSYACRLDLLQDNPARRVKIQRAKRPEKKIYTVEEAERFLELMQSESLPFQCFFLLAIYGGFRREELLGFEWSDIDFKNHVVTVNRASLYTKDLGVFTDVPKTKNSHRSIKLPDCIFPTLQRYKIKQAERRLKLGDKWINSNRLFTTWNGKPQHPSCMPKTLKRFCNKNGLPYYGIHSFRHLNASLLITSGVDVRTVSASLGHSQTSTTLDIYSHTFEAVQAQASQAIANALPFSNEKKA
jgi:integrase